MLSKLLLWASRYEGGGEKVKRKRTEKEENAEAYINPLKPNVNYKSQLL
jgi:hypothetical protein